jgi:hypothetical protein
MPENEPENILKIQLRWERIRGFDAITDLSFAPSRPGMFALKSARFPRPFKHFNTTIPKSPAISNPFKLLRLVTLCYTKIFTHRPAFCRP